MTVLAETRDLVKSFGHVTAVGGVSVDVREGEVVGLLGSNGAGKTTLIRCLLGLVTRDGGSVSLLGEPPNREVLRRVGYVPQGLGLYADLTIAENLDFRRQVYGHANTTDREPEEANDIPVGRLGLGTQRRAAFKAALAHRPRLLILDEPTSGVSPLGRAQLWDTIRDVVESGAGALVTTHHLEEAEQCDRLVMMSGGRVVAHGSLADVIGDRTALDISPDDRAAAFNSLSASGLAVSLDGRHLRLLAGDRGAVERILLEAGVSARIQEVPATLDEAFVALSV